MAANDWSGIFFIAFFVMLAGSVWGAVVLALKWPTNVWARIFLGLGLGAVFWVAGTTAIISGCVAIAGSPNFH